MICARYYFILLTLGSITPIEATTTDGSITICPSNKILMPSNSRYKKEMSRINKVSFYLNNSNNVPLVSIKIKRNEHKNVPLKITRLPYLPISNLAHLLKKGAITFCDCHKEYYIEIKNSLKSTFARRLEAAANQIEELQKKQAKNQINREFRQHVGYLRAQQAAYRHFQQFARQKKYSDQNDMVQSPYTRAVQFLENSSTDIDTDKDY